MVNAHLKCPYMVIDGEAGPIKADRFNTDRAI